MMSKLQGEAYLRVQHTRAYSCEIKRTNLVDDSTSNVINSDFFRACEEAIHVSSIDHRVFAPNLLDCLVFLVRAPVA